MKHTALTMTGTLTMTAIGWVFGIATATSEEVSKDVPESRAGRDMIGELFSLEGLAWLNAPKGESLETEGKVTLVRWWTETCPYCKASLPAVTRLAEKYKDEPFQIVAVYHPKPPRPVKDAGVLEAARAFGYDGVVAKDTRWAVLRNQYLDKKRRPATSVSFLLDQDGKVRFVHPGPEFRPSDDPKDHQVNADYEALDQAIRALIEEIRQRPDDTEAQ